MRGQLPDDEGGGVQPKGTGGGGVKVQTGKGQVDRQVAAQHTCGTGGGAAQTDRVQQSQSGVHEQHGVPCAEPAAATTSTAV